MKKNFTRQALPAVAMMMVASLSLVGTTYAWFTQNETAKVDEVQVAVSDAAGGIAIATAANGSYGTAFYGEDVFTSTDLKPVSNSCVLTSTALGSGDFTWYEATVDSGDSSKVASATELVFVADSDENGPHKKDYYIDFDIFFENSNSEAKNIYFNYADVSAMFIADNDSHIAGGASAELSKAALRVAFINQGYSTTKPTTADFTPALGTNATAVVVEPYDTTHQPTVTSSTAPIDTYGIKDAFSTSRLINPTEASDIAAATNESTGWYTEQDTKTVASVNGGTATAATDSLFTLQPGYTKITVKIWLEGQDVDCINAISGKDVMMDLEFTVNSVTTSSN